MNKIKKQDFGSFVVVTHMQKEEESQKLIIQPTGPFEGRDEMNLVELPFSLLSPRNSKHIKRVCIF